MMKSFVRAPNPDHYGTVITVVFLLAVLVFHAPAWVLLLILVGGVSLFARLSDRAYYRERGLR
jgi:hypothetical protein